MCSASTTSTHSCGSQAFLGSLLLSPTTHSRSMHGIILWWFVQQAPICRFMWMASLRDSRQHLLNWIPLHTLLTTSLSATLPIIMHQTVRFKTLLCTTSLSQQLKYLITTTVSLFLVKQLCSTTHHTVTTIVLPAIRVNSAKPQRVPAVLVRMEALVR